MTTIRANRTACGIALLMALFPATALHAQADIGTWVREVGAATPGAITMTIEACCGGGRRITYHLADLKQVMSLESRFDGSVAQVMLDGKPSGETMAIKRLDDHHLYTVLTMGGKPFGTSKATVSADGKTLTVVNDFTVAAGGQQVGNNTEVWVRK